MNQPAVAGLDVGGANIKLAGPGDRCQHLPFALWEQPDDLQAILCRMLEEGPAIQRLALTMTGELTDCFATKREGVAFIMRAVTAAADCPVRVWLTSGHFATPEQACQRFLEAAASNWHGLASWLARQDLDGAGRGLLIDTGSTTTDVIPFASGRVLARGKTDLQRLVNYELVYTGAIRSPLVGLASSLVFRDQKCPLMNELFATALDIHVLLGHLPPGSCPEYAADHTGTSVEQCIARLARLVGLDHSLLERQEAMDLARQLHQRQLDLLTDAVERVITEHGVPEVVVVSGQGEFLARMAWQALRARSAEPALAAARLISFADRFGVVHSSCATAVAMLGLLGDPSVAQGDDDPVSRLGITR